MSPLSSSAVSAVPCAASTSAVPAATSAAYEVASAAFRVVSAAAEWCQGSASTVVHRRCSVGAAFSVVIFMLLLGPDYSEYNMM